MRKPTTFEVGTILKTFSISLYCACYDVIRHVTFDLQKMIPHFSANKKFIAPKLKSYMLIKLVLYRIVYDNFVIRFVSSV